MKMKIVVFCALIGIATLPCLDAKIVQLPDKNPYFSVTVPDGWTCKTDADGDLNCRADDNSGVSVSATITKWRTEEQMNAHLPTLGEKLASALKLENVEHSKVREATSSENVKLWRLETAGLKDGIRLKCWVVAFRTGDNPFIMMSGVIPNDHKEHQKRVEQMVDSIAPVRSEERAKRSGLGFDPYKGPLMTLLPAEMSESESGLKFKLSATADRTAGWKEERAIEAVGFNYKQTVIVIVEIKGALVNFATSADAVCRAQGHGCRKRGHCDSQGQRPAVHGAEWEDNWLDQRLAPVCCGRRNGSCSRRFRESGPLLTSNLRRRRPLYRIRDLRPLNLPKPALPRRVVLANT